MNKDAIGAITYRSGDRYAQINYFQKLATIAYQYDVPFFIFSVDDVNVTDRKIHGLWYIPEQKKWVRKWTDFPKIVYDHVRYHPTPQFQRYVQLRKSGLMKFSYNGYANKWIVIDYLSSFPDLAPHIPETEKVEQFDQVLTFIEKGASILKPFNGTGGRDIFKITKDGERWIVEGKGTKYRMSKDALKNWLEQLVKNERFLIQRLIPIQYDGRTCDTRVLIQKNSAGKWSFTGMGTRIGRVNSVASNLAKGAKAIRTDEFIKQFLRLDPKPIMAEIERVGLLIAKRLEERFGNFVEFGLDVGIMPNGHFQLIEANSKPDRKIFKRTNQFSQFEWAIRKPLEYHIYLCKEQRD